MTRTVVSSLVLFTIFIRVIAGSLHADSPPKITLDGATVTGLTSGPVNQFLGIPFAEPPTGNLRFQLPKKLPSYTASFSATQYGPACSQQEQLTPPGLNVPPPPFLHSAEDCLTLNVVAPATATPTSNLPVVMWIYGGGYENGAAILHVSYNGSVVVEKAISLEVPVVYVSINYRVSAFGFLASQEVKEAGVGNLGLHDQRLALKWVQRYIHEFGGDPDKVTIWGQSAGAMSIAFQMVTNGGNAEGLFRAAIMNSGAISPLGDISQGQPYYDALVAETGCSGATDTLQCLREVPYETLLSAVNQSPGVFSYQSVDLAWVPRVDGVFLTAGSRQLVEQGSVANIPFIASNCDDEGTLFAFSNQNITTDAQFEEYISTYMVSGASSAELTQLMTYYPSDPALGSPFDTGDKNALTPQFKRVAAFLGDLQFQAPRHFLIQSLSGKQNVWAYLYKRGKLTPYLGASHGSDLPNMYGGGDVLPYLLRFVAHLDPNAGESTDLYWPRYDAMANQTMLSFLDGSVPLALTTDTDRAEAMSYLASVSFAHPW